jgi:hypothetical protein
MTKSRSESVSLQRALVFQTLQERFSVLEALAHDLTGSVGTTLNFLEVAARDQSRKILPRLVTATELAARSVTSLKRLLWELNDLRSETEHARRRDPELKSTRTETQGAERRTGIERRASSAVTG